MCEYLSFVITKGSKPRFLTEPNMESHSGIEVFHKLKPDSYYEAEWTEDNENTLVVRALDKETSQKIRALVIATFKTRENLLAHFTKWFEKTGALYRGKISRAGDRGIAIAGGFGISLAEFEGKSTAGDNGMAKVGNAGISTVGNCGIATAGSNGIAKAGDNGTANAGDFGTATAGNDGIAKAGDNGTANAGDRGTAIAGNFGQATAGNFGIAKTGDYGTSVVCRNGTAIARHFGTAIAGNFGTAITRCTGEASAGVDGVLIFIDGETSMTVFVDGVNVLPYTLYKISDGKVIPSNNQSPLNHKETP